MRVERGAGTSRGRAASSWILSAVGRIAVLVLVFLVLGALWEGYRWLWMQTGWRRPFIVDLTTMPHLHDVVGVLSEPTREGGPLLVDLLLPRHFFSDDPALEDVPLARLMGTGVVWRIGKPLDGMIEPEDFERMRPQLEPGDILLLNTGVTQYVGTPDYDRHAALSVAAAEWLVDKKIKLLAVDTPTPDIPIHKRPQGLDWPVHHTLLRDGVLISEQVATRSLAGRRAEFLFLPLNIVGGDGAPARVLGRAIRD